MAYFWKCDFTVCIKRQLLDLPTTNYATIADLVGIDTTGVDTTKVTSKTDLDSLRATIENLDLDKNQTVPADLIKLGNALDNYVVKKNGYQSQCY